MCDVHLSEHLYTGIRHKMSFTSMASLFQEKFELKMAMKEKELEVRRMELELQKRKWEFEEEEKRLRLHADAEERRALIELLKNQVRV